MPWTIPTIYGGDPFAGSLFGANQTTVGTHA
jgi:hypothetical protein